MVNVDGFDFPLLYLDGPFRVALVLHLLDRLRDEKVDHLFRFIEHIDEDEVLIIGEVLQQIVFHRHPFRRGPDADPYLREPF